MCSTVPTASGHVAKLSPWFRSVLPVARRKRRRAEDVGICAIGSLPAKGNRHANPTQQIYPAALDCSDRRDLVLCDRHRLLHGMDSTLGQTSSPPIAVIR